MRCPNNHLGVPNAKQEQTDSTVAVCSPVPREKSKHLKTHGHVVRRRRELAHARRRITVGLAHVADDFRPPSRTRGEKPSVGVRQRGERQHRAAKQIAHLGDKRRSFRRVVSHGRLALDRAAPQGVARVLQSLETHEFPPFRVSVDGGFFQNPLLRCLLNTYARATGQNRTRKDISGHRASKNIDVFDVFVAIYRTFRRG